MLANTKNLMKVICRKIRTVRNSTIPLRSTILKLGFYDKALEKFDAAIEHDLNNPETYLYTAVCVLADRKPVLTPRPEIDRIEKYINAALTDRRKRAVPLFSGVYQIRLLQTKILQDIANMGRMSCADKGGLFFSDRRKPVVLCFEAGNTKLHIGAECPEHKTRRNLDVF